MVIREKCNMKKIESGELIYIGRGLRYYPELKCSKWHNPFPVKKYGREKAISLFEAYITTGDGKHLLNDLHELRDKKICCHCKIDEPCHGDILIKLVNEKYEI